LDGRRRTFKSETYRSLRLAAPTDEEIAAGATAPPGFIHLPRGAEAEWIKRLVAEQLVTVTTRRGFHKLEWQKLREPNEVLDCRVYARAAAWIAGADRWSGAKWRDLEDQLGPAPGQTDGNRLGDEPAPVTAGMLPRAARDRHAPLHLARRGQRMVEVTWAGNRDCRAFVAVMAVGRMQAGGQGALSVYESIAAAAAAFRKESGNTTGAASLRGIGDGWGQFGDSWDQFGD
jgi:hypothetical protein